MCNANPNLRSAHWVPWLATVLMALSLLLSGCFDGTTGDRGPAGADGEDGEEGPAGPAGPSGVNLSTLGVTVVDAGVTANPGRPWVDIEVTALSQFGTPVVLRPDDFGVDFFEFGFSRLVNRGGYESWQPYVASATNTHADSGISPAIQVIRAGALRGHTGGEWEHQGGGVWRFYMDIDVNDVPAPYTAGNVFFNEDTPVTAADWAAYTGNETHRVSVLLRPSTGNWEPTHDFMDFVPNGGAPVDKHVVANASCNNCHDLLGGQVSQNSIHGRTRTGAEHCTACHNQYHIGTRTVEPVDMAYLGHQIHSGSGIANEPTHLQYNWASATIHPTRYMAYYPNDIKNCSTCHDSSVASGADRAHTKPTVQACGSCHNNVDFATGVGHVGGPQADSTACAGCHAPGGNLGADVRHLDVGREFARAGDLRYVINSMERDGDTLTVEWQVLYNGTPIESGADGWTVGATLLVGWGDEDYTHSNEALLGGATGPAAGMRPGNALSIGNAQNSPFADGVYTTVVDLSAENHAGSTKYVASLGGNVNGGGLTALVASNAVSYLGQARRQVATMAACTTCHEDRYGVFNKHGANRHNDVERCIICHNNNSTDIQRRSRVDGDGVQQPASPDGKDEQATNFMVMAHAIHGQGFREEMISIAANAFGVYNTKDARRYPGRLANCNQCHTGTTYYGMGPRGTTFDSSTGLGRSDVDGHIKTTAAMAACSSCHDSTGAKAHMKVMGGQDESTQAVYDASAFETCGTCHGAGRAADVRVVHGLN
jgi:OmcA/MtrC family decaheme c-type cytochrome